MSGERWTETARFFTASIVGFLLTAGLCGYGGFGSPGEQRLSDLQVKATGAGAFLFLLSFWIFVAACYEVGKARRKRRKL